MNEFVNRMSSSFQSEMAKIAQARVKEGGLINKYTIGGAGAIAGWEGLKKVEKDRKLGRAVRQQQGGGY
jgi:hypothetical protein